MRPIITPPKNGLRPQIAAYLRVSKSTDLTNSHTFETQMQDILRDLDRIFGQGRHDVKWFCDDGFSGALGSEPTLKYRKIRPEFRAMRLGLQHGEYDVMAVHSVNRLARESRHVVNVIKDDLVYTDTDFLSVTESSIDIYTAEGMLMLQTMSNVAEYQRDQNSKRCQQASETTFLKGFVGNPPGYGWCLDSPGGIAHKQRKRPDLPISAIMEAQRKTVVQAAPAQAALAQVSTDLVQGPTGSLEATSDTAEIASPTIDFASSPLSPLQAGISVGTPVFGAERPRAAILPIPHEREVVLLMKELLFKGRGVTAIARELNARGIPSADASLWTPGGVRRALLDPLHAGFVHRLDKRTGKKRLNAGKHFAHRFFDFEEYERIEAQLVRRAKNTRTNTTKTLQRYPLNGLVFCAHCGSRLHISSSETTYPSLRCTHGTEHGQRSCPHLTVRYHQLAEIVEEELMALGRLPLMQQALHQQALLLVDEQREIAQRDVALWQRSVAALDKRINGLVNALGDGVIGRDLFEPQMARLQGEQATAQRDLDNARTCFDRAGHSHERMAQVEVALEDFPGLWSKLDNLERHQVLDLLIEGLTVHREGERITLGLTVYGFAERCISYGHYRRAKKAIKRRGVDRLSRREMAALHLWAQKLTRSEIAEQMGLVPSAVSGFLSRARQVMGTQHLDEIVALARPRINGMLHTLPLGPQEKYRRADGPLLSSKLMEILPLLVQGARHRDICAETGLSVTMVAGRHTEINKLLGVNKRLDLSRKVKELGLLNE